MDLSECRDACLQTHVACLHAATHVLQKGEAHPRDLVRTLWDCADQTVVAANLMSRGSPFHHVTCGACAALCAAVVLEAGAAGAAVDPIVAACVAHAERCAKLCREMAEHAAPGARAAAE
jgi:hypothetical protein